MQTLIEFAKETGMRDTVLASLLVSAGLQAVREVGFDRIPLRLQFTVKTIDKKHP
jgi:hypothetical protein